MTEPQRSEYGPLIEEAECLLIEPLRVCSRGHAIFRDDPDELAKDEVCGAGGTCDAALFTGFLMQGDEMNPHQIVRQLIDALAAQIGSQGGSDV